MPVRKMPANTELANVISTLLLSHKLDFNALCEKIDVIKINPSNEKTIYKMCLRRHCLQAT